MLPDLEMEGMSGNRSKRRKQPWRDSLIATTGLSVFTVAASMLWNSGHPEWAFALAFLAVWMLVAISWSNIDFTEESGSILARIVDHNFTHLHERIEELEQELAEIRNVPPAPGSGSQNGSGWA